jgi:5'-phosphate synthase pdxT subunit
VAAAPDRLDLLPTVGVLALQGDFAEHAACLRRLNIEPLEIRTPAQLFAVDGLIIPGGESTAMAKLMDIYGFREPIKAFATARKPVWGTCAGLILVADRLVGDRPEPLGLLPMLVDRNAFGRQMDSFETDLDIEGLDGGPFHGVFIRAPAVRETGKGVQVLARLDDGRVVAVRKEHVLGTAFHPELTQDLRMHRYFVDMVRQAVRP